MNYRAIYDRLMDRARQRELRGYVERHHVLPKCLGGSNNPSNIARLTAEEHYVAHQILVRLYPEHAGIAWAALRLARVAKSHRAYGWLRRRHGAAVTQRQAGRRRAASTIAKMVAGNKGRSLSAEHKRVLAIRSSGNSHRKGRRNSAEHNMRISASLRGNKNSVGHKPSLETRAKMSAARSAYWAERRAAA